MLLQYISLVTSLLHSLPPPGSSLPHHHPHQALLHHHTTNTAAFTSHRQVAGKLSSASQKRQTHVTPL
ncbi:hypothetical protein E2C01_087494 [Portunus trituberculatus]|uniref:Uncharacterized protein n=1 Tax=Portunus trituberculatus TaxID=210409 RepID=A0A5B7JE66_PORTR|nr:hypothetical protein [Portunus trituberculatus]